MSSGANSDYSTYLYSDSESSSSSSQQQGSIGGDSVQLGIFPASQTAEHSSSYSTVAPPSYKNASAVPGAASVAQMETGGTTSAVARKERAWYASWRGWAACGCVLFALIVLILIATIPNGFQYVEWNEYVLMRGVHPHNAGVKTNKVYSNGRYWTGTGYDQLKYPRTFNTIVYKEGSPSGTILAFTDSGIEFSIECSYLYWIIPEQIPLLYSLYPTSYHSRIAALGLRALKNVAPNYSLRQYVTNRDEIQLAMYNSLASELASLCGNVPCVEIRGRRHFQLRRAVVPSQIRSTWLNAAVQNQVNIKQEAEQVRVLVVKETDRLRAEISANITLVNTSAAAEAHRIRTSAVAEADRIRAEANAEAFRIREQAKGSGIQSVLTALNISDSEGTRELLSLLTVMDSTNTDVKSLYQSTSVFSDPSTRVILGASNAVVSV
ncbi:uncharacterized protein AMSG_10244 [Thecamonas trahens ATCC 50062]|uniref:Band 7 domain-containing protein n=1 Tax=Thecamonas trahens ATCC 50062 TaxID=461836 RepID=A0A0L0DSI5_THETB|nr:hypothetical protein AMSG_10244 [Thecamonas trahens ATCC 50062]KNC54996.1 hypothetical protein AMSG_10244 [Thecamonas trahens ATCC 50062]|eukprot:XP_013753440.1 hypothetical protein AMSG_10244 [Thecamonas trahens ATCC 50062]